MPVPMPFSYPAAPAQQQFTSPAAPPSPYSYSPAVSTPDAANGFYGGTPMFPPDPHNQPQSYNPGTPSTTSSPNTPVGAPSPVMPPQVPHEQNSPMYGQSGSYSPYALAGSQPGSQQYQQSYPQPGVVQLHQAGSGYPAYQQY
jgi:hypothetical protein